MQDNNKGKQRLKSMLSVTVSIAVMAILVSSALSVGPFLIQSAWALPYVSSVSVSPSSTEKTKGETATFTVTVSRASGQGSGDVNLSFQSSTIPSGAASFSNAKVTFGNGGSNSKTTTLTINTNNLDIQEHTFTVKGTKSNAASDSATSSSTTLKVTRPPNQAPTANAGSDQTVNEGDTVHLDGSASADPDGTIASYSWTQTAGTAATLTGANSKTPSFTAPDVGANGDTLTFELKVTDSDGATATDTVNVKINNVVVNQAPTANAGSDQTVNEGASVSLDGSASSDADGDTLTYAWTQTAGTAATLTGADSATPSFTAPDVTPNGDTLTFKLTVMDNDGATSTIADTVDIKINNVIVNRAPTANAGDDQIVSENQAAYLDGSGSFDPDGNILRYSWTQTAGTAATLTGADSATPSFTAPDVGANGDTLTFELKVTDSDGVTATDTIGVTVNNVNQAPTAKITADPTTVNEGGSSALDATTSSDLDGTISTYEFSQTAGTPGTITVDNTNPAKATFSTPSVSAGETATILVKVTDSGGATNTATVDIAIVNVNQAPNVLLTASPTTIQEGQTSALDGSASNDDAGIVQYIFEQVSGTPGTITVDNTNPAKATFTAPSISADEIATINLTVRDGEGASNSTGVSIAVKNAPAHATTLTLNPITSVLWGNDVTVTGKLSDNAASGAGVGGATITFDGTGAANLQPVTTNADGTFTAKGKSPTSVATGWRVQAHFAANSDYGASNSVIRTYSTTKHTTLVAVAATTTTPWGMPTAFTVTVTDGSTGGTVLQGKTISFNGTGVIGVANVITGADGKAVGTGTAPGTVATGWTVQAHFAGDSLYNAKDSTIRTYSTTKHATGLSFTVPTTSVAPGASYKVSGTLTDTTTGTQLASKTITFTADAPITIASQTTNTNGFYSATQAAPATAGTYNTQSHFAGDSQYNAKDSVIKPLTVS